jgi:3-phosphoshikimate 1-carboxyvinyltransferase
VNQPAGPLDCGNSGSTMRMISGLLSAQQGEFTLVGDASLSRRPMKRIQTPLEAMGAQPHAHRRPRAHPYSRLATERHRLHHARPSAQVKTCVLLAGLQPPEKPPCAKHPHPRPQRARPARLRSQVERSVDSVSITGPQTLHAIEAAVPGDISSAAFFLCAAALFPGSQLLLDSLGLNPTRATLLDVLTALGLQISVLNLEDKHSELVGNGAGDRAPEGLGSTSITGALAAQLIDELPVLAAIAPTPRRHPHPRRQGAARERERPHRPRRPKPARHGRRSHRTRRRHGCPGGQKLHGATIDSGGDHRIAMAFSVAALRAEGETLIQGSESANISFPEFFDLLEFVAER